MSEIKVKIQTLKSDAHELKILTSDTVAQVKVKVETDLNLGMKAAEMTLIHLGKVLEDDNQTMADAKVENDSRMVLMKQRKKPAKKAKKAAKGDEPEAETPAPAAAPATPSAASPPAPAATPAPENKATQPAPGGLSGAAPAASSTASSAMALGPEMQNTIAFLHSLGDFTDEQVHGALRAAFNNPDRAAEYLFTGIPAHVLAQQAQGGGGGGGGGGPGPAQGGNAQAQAQAQAALAAQMQMDNDGGDDGEMGDDGGLPPQQLAQFAAAIQQNPEMLQQMMQDPQISQMMAPLLAQMLAGGHGGGGGGGGGMPPMPPQGGGHGVPPGATAVQVTAEEHAALTRLQGLDPRITQGMAYQAFVVCDRNEEHAANFLLNQLFGEDN